MFVLVLANGYPSERYMLAPFQFDQAKALQKYGNCKVVYVAIDLRSLRRWRKWGTEHFFKDGVEVYAINIPLGRVPHSLLKVCGQWALKYLYKIIEKDHGRPDIIHAHFLDIGAIAVCLKGIVKAKFVLTEHGSNVNIPKDKMSKWVIASAQQIYSLFDVVIAVSDALSDNINKSFDAHSIVIHNMLDANFVDIPYSTQSRSNGLFEFTFVGNLIQGKCPVECIVAFYKAFVAMLFTDSHGNFIHLKIIGSGPLVGQCRTAVAKLGISNYVTLLGQQTRQRVRQELLNSSCFVLPSRRETFGVAYIEAMACGLPVIATKCGGPESFVNDENGILVPVDDENALVNAFRYMLDNAKKYNSNHIMEDTRNKFSSEQIAKQIVNIYYRD